MQARTRHGGSTRSGTAPLYAFVPIQPTSPQRRRIGPKDRTHAQHLDVLAPAQDLHPSRMPPPSNPHDNEKQAAAQQAVDILHEISTILVGSAAAHPALVSGGEAG